MAHLKHQDQSRFLMSVPVRVPVAVPISIPVPIQVKRSTMSKYSSLLKSQKKGGRFAIIKKSIKGRNTDKKRYCISVCKAPSKSKLCEQRSTRLSSDLVLSKSKSKNKSTSSPSPSSSYNSNMCKSNMHSKKQLKKQFKGQLSTKLKPQLKSKLKSASKLVFQQSQKYQQLSTTSRSASHQPRKARVSPMKVLKTKSLLPHLQSNQYFNNNTRDTIDERDHCSKKCINEQCKENEQQYNEKSTTTTVNTTSRMMSFNKDNARSVDHRVITNPSQIPLFSIFNRSSTRQQLNDVNQLILPIDNITNGAHISSLVISLWKKLKSPFPLNLVPVMYNLVLFATSFGPLSDSDISAIVQRGYYLFPRGRALCVAHEGGSYTITRPPTLPNGDAYPVGYNPTRWWATTGKRTDGSKGLMWSGRIATVGFIVGLHIPAISESGNATKRICCLGYTPQGDSASSTINNAQHQSNEGPIGPCPIGGDGKTHIIETSLARLGLSLAAATWTLSARLGELGYAGRMAHIPNFMLKSVHESSGRENTTGFKCRAFMSIHMLFGSVDSHGSCMSAPMNLCLNEYVRRGKSPVDDAVINMFKMYIRSADDLLPYGISPPSNEEIIASLGHKPMQWFKNRQPVRRLHQERNHCSLLYPTSQMKSHHTSTSKVDSKSKNSQRKSKSKSESKLINGPPTTLPSKGINKMLTHQNTLTTHHNVPNTLMNEQSNGPQINVLNQSLSQQQPTLKGGSVTSEYLVVLKYTVSDIMSICLQNIVVNNDSDPFVCGRCLHIDRSIVTLSVKYVLQSLFANNSVKCLKCFTNSNIDIVAKLLIELSNHHFALDQNNTTTLTTNACVMCINNSCHDHGCDSYKLKRQRLSYLGIPI